MATVIFQVRRVGEDWDSHDEAARAFGDFEQRLKTVQGPYRQRLTGDLFGPAFALDETMHRVKDKFAQGDPGTKVIVRGSNEDGRRMAIRKTAVSDGPQVLKVGYAQIGDDYSWGASGPDQFDCSGFTLYCYEHGASAWLPHSAYQQYHDTVQKISIANPEKLKPGDLLFYNVPNGRPAPNHVGIFAGVHDGKRKVLDASSSADAIVFRDWDLNPLYAFGFLPSVTGQH